MWFLHSSTPWTRRLIPGPSLTSTSASPADGSHPVANPAKPSQRCATACPRVAHRPSDQSSIHRHSDVAVRPASLEAARHHRTLWPGRVPGQHPQHVLARFAERGVVLACPPLILGAAAANVTRPGPRYLLQLRPSTGPAGSPACGRHRRSPRQSVDRGRYLALERAAEPAVPCPLLPPSSKLIASGYCRSSPLSARQSPTQTHVAEHRVGLAVPSPST